jgi:hypothetical protein
MKRLLFLTLSLMPLLSMAQDDDLYFTPTKKRAKNVNTSAQVYNVTDDSDRKYSVYSNNTRSDDEYNRRYSNTDGAYQMSGGSDTLNMGAVRVDTVYKYIVKNNYYSDYSYSLGFRRFRHRYYDPFYWDWDYYYLWGDPWAYSYYYPYGTWGYYSPYWYGGWHGGWYGYNYGWYGYYDWYAWNNPWHYHGGYVGGSSHHNFTSHSNRGGFGSFSSNASYGGRRSDSRYNYSERSGNGRSSYTNRGSTLSERRADREKYNNGGSRNSSTGRDYFGRNSYSSSTSRNSSSVSAPTRSYNSSSSSSSNNSHSTYSRSSSSSSSYSGGRSYSGGGGSYSGGRSSGGGGRSGGSAGGRR